MRADLVVGCDAAHSRRARPTPRVGDMSPIEDTMPGGRYLERFGLGTATLQAAIQADLEESARDLTAATIASAVARAIAANNEEVLRQLNETLAADRSSR